MKTRHLFALAVLATELVAACTSNTAPPPSTEAPAPQSPSLPTAPAATAPIPDNTFSTYCAGAGCSAVNTSTYSGTGIGAWSYSNTTDTPATLDVHIAGVHQGNTAIVIFSNGQPSSTSPPQIPNSLKHQGAPHPTPASIDPILLRAALRDRAHGGMLERNRQRAIELIGGRVANAPNGDLTAAAPPVPSAPPAIGTTKTWYDNFSAPANKYTAAVRISCRLPSSRNAVFWVDTSGPAIDVQPFSAAFCGETGGYARVTALLGDVWGPATRANPGALITDAPGLQNLNIVFLNVPPGTGWGGYFGDINNFRRNSTDLKTSNESLAFFINAPDVSSGLNYYLSTLLHELTHMVNFYQRAVKRGVAHDTWLEETSAMMTEDIVVPAVVSSGYSNIADQRVAPYLASGGDVSLVNWPELSAPHYSMGGSLGAFLDRRYGVRMYQGIISCDASRAPPSYGCVDSLIKQFGGKGFGDESARFAATIFAELPPGSPLDFGYPLVSNASYTMKPIDMAPFAAQRPDIASPLGDTFPATSHTYSIGTIGPGTTQLVATGIKIPPHSAMVLVIK